MADLTLFVQNPNQPQSTKITTVEVSATSKVIFYSQQLPVLGVGYVRNLYLNSSNSGSSIYLVMENGWIYDFDFSFCTDIDGRPYAPLAQDADFNDTLTRHIEVYEQLNELFRACCPSSGGGGDFVPYTGATGDVDLGAHGLTTDFIQYNLIPASTLEEGRSQWNDTDGTLDVRLKGNNVTLQVGQEQVARVVNKSGGDLTEAGYAVVRSRLVSEGGASGQRLAVVLAQADTINDCSTTLGLVTENIANNLEGFVTTNGIVRDINTTGSLQGETWVDGDVLYLSPSVAGGLTNVEPSAPNYIVIVGYVVYAHNTNGKIFVNVQNEYRLNALPYIPLAGTNVGAPVTGDVEIEGGTFVRFFQENGSVLKEITFEDDNSFSIKSTDIGTGYVSYLTFDTNRIDFYTTAPTSTGISYASGVSESNLDVNSLINLEVLKKRFWTKAGTPTTSDDSTQGFVVGSLIYDTTNDIIYRCTNNSASAATWVLFYNPDVIENVQVIPLSGANVTTTSATAVDITGLVTPTLPANSSWYFEIYLATTCTGAGGIRFGFTTPSGGSGFLYVEGIGTGVTSFQSGVSTGSLIATGVTRVNGNAQARLFGRISIGSTAGAVQIQFASGTAGQTSTIGAGNGASMMRITKVA